MGELIALLVAVSWTATAVFAEIATKRLGTLVVNVVRMGLSVALLSLMLFIFAGSPVPQSMNTETVMWFGLSGIVGYVIGDYCLYKCYTYIGSRFGQLIMTLSSLFAAVAGYLLLSETIPLKAGLGMAITIVGIGISILNKGTNGKKIELKLSATGILLGLGAAMGQGVGLVLSKLGMENYKISAQGGSEAIINMMPFAGTFVRGIVGFICFATLLIISGNSKAFKEGIHDRKGMTYSLLCSIFGPVIGVSLSLLAVSLANTGIAQTIMSISPVLILVPSYFIFKQKITFIEVIGAIISVVGVVILIL
ncbi:MAG: DMT family transporter [Paludibacteraceae bacterium]|nr:DMT family transporter [Paludibacteraceae bacterium]